ncbi:protein CUSTOS isoform X2 [Rhinatrema bivittatum]|uniref:protein CUSTOS isoform X2 n=1 Tax=Rhinatrema bivittatum TaxID=194408 RepID=UPI001127B863|nr:protein CUSTOS isoform X2 [Rhinatrema bivittatum]
MAESDSDSSEDLEQFREAVWEPTGSQRDGIRKELSLAVTYPSLRLKAEDRESNGSELQTTPAFREYVAKKLEAMIDRCISMSQVEATPAVTSFPATQSQEDGFRLFFSSVAGDCGKAAIAPSSKRCAPSSSSEGDSEDEWQRYREAAVSVTDILKQSPLPIMHPQANQVNGWQESDEKNMKLKIKQKKERVKKAAGEKREKTTPCMTHACESDYQGNSMSHPASSTGGRRKKGKGP